MRYKSICAISVVSLAVLLGNAALGQQRAQGQRGRGAGGGEAAAAPGAPAGKTALWSNEDNQKRWKDKEAKKKNKSPPFNGPHKINTQVCILVAEDSPLTPETAADLWRNTGG